MDVKWDALMEKTWSEFKSVLESAQRRSMDFYSVDEDLILLTDASSAFWSAVVLQTPMITDKQESLLNG